MTMVKAASFKFRLFSVLWLSGMPGILSLVMLPLPVEAPAPATVVKAAMLIQPTILLSLAGLVGVQLAPRVGLTAPGAEALAAGRSWRRAVSPQVLPGVLGGLGSGLLLVAIAALSQPLLPSELLTAEPMPLPIRFLYGGITEEILLRWGVMTLLLWLGWRFGQGRQGNPKSVWVAVAIGVSAFLFAIAHLPVLVAQGIPLTPLLVSYILVQNSLFAVVAGFLYWRYGLESAMVAHIMAHVVMLLGA
jgi:hypothetical protein